MLKYSPGRDDKVARFPEERLRLVTVAGYDRRARSDLPICVQAVRSWLGGYSLQIGLFWARRRGVRAAAPGITYSRVRAEVRGSGCFWRRAGVRRGGPGAVAGAAGLYGGGGGGYGTAVGEAVTAVGAMHGFPAVRTSFVGRAGPVRELAVLLEAVPAGDGDRAGGSGKTRLAGEVARQVAGRFADGVWLVELAPVQDPEQVAAVVAAALGVREQPGVPIAGTLARVLARQQLLLVLDNCEHVLGAAAGLCAELHGGLR